MVLKARSALILLCISVHILVYIICVWKRSDIAHPNKSGPCDCACAAMLFILSVYVYFFFFFFGGFCCFSVRRRCLRILVDAQMPIHNSTITAKVKHGVWQNETRRCVSITFVERCVRTAFRCSVFRRCLMCTVVTRFACRTALGWIW